jgi:hypothetical protein
MTATRGGTLAAALPAAPRLDGGAINNNGHFVASNRGG